tara:strand:+ start:209 stop:370 length:162 start_codon:yes stop_codon:yes gene_type:complete
LKISNFFQGSSVIRKTIKDIPKIVGPVDVFQVIEEYKPKTTDMTPIMLANIAI